MAPTYRTSLKSTRMAAIVTDLGSGSKLVIGTSALSGATGVLATFTLNSTAATESGGVLTFSGMPKTATASGSGTAAKAELRNSSDVTIASGLTVGTSAADVIISNTTINSGETITATSLTITHG